MAANTRSCARAKSQREKMQMYPPYKVALIDLMGTIHNGDGCPIGSSADALKRLRETGIQVRFVTNTTTRSRFNLHNELLRMGVRVSVSEIHSALAATKKYVVEQELNPFYFLTPEARADFPQAMTGKPYDAVVVGLAETEFTYSNLNEAYRILRRGHPLIAIHENKFYKAAGADQFSLGPGCFTRGLEYASNVQPIVIGKPNRYFFESALPPGVTNEEVIMIGDDGITDIKGALDIGMNAILVKTGKFTPDVLKQIPKPTVVVDDFSMAVDYITEQMYQAIMGHFNND